MPSDHKEFKQKWDQLSGQPANTFPPDEVRTIIRQYGESCFSNKKDRHVRMQSLLPELKQGSQILDYGCGVGQISNFFTERYYSYVDAVDISQDEIDKAKIAYGNNKKINFQKITAGDNLKSNFYDLIFSSAVIEHTHNPGNYLKGINHALKVGGYLIIGMPNNINPRFITQTLVMNKRRVTELSSLVLKTYNKATTHIQSFDSFHFTSLLSSCGFLVEDYLPMEGIPLSFYFQKILNLFTFGFFFKSPLYIKFRIPFLERLSYTMFFRAKKIKSVDIPSFF